MSGKTFSDRSIAVLNKTIGRVWGRQMPQGDQTGEAHRPANGTAWVRIVGSLPSGTPLTPASTFVNFLEPNPDSDAFPRPYREIDDEDFKNYQVAIRQCFGTGGSSSSSGGSLYGYCEYLQGEWTLMKVLRCKTIVTGVSCGSSGLTVTTDTING